MVIVQSLEHWIIRCIEIPHDPQDPMLGPCALSHRLKPPKWRPHETNTGNTHTLSPNNTITEYLT